MTTCPHIVERFQGNPALYGALFGLGVLLFLGIYTTMVLLYVPGSPWLLNRLKLRRMPQLLSPEDYDIELPRLSRTSMSSAMEDP